MSLNLDEIRDRNPIETLVNEKFTLRQVGSRWVGVEHDSLVITPSSGFYFWNSRAEHGDVFDFVGRYHLNYGDAWDNRNATQFLEAAHWLANRAGITIEEASGLHQSVSWSFRQLVSRMHDALLKYPPALKYATEGRGWNLSNVRASRLGFMPGDKKQLLADLTLPESWSRMIRAFPAGMLIYPHFQDGRLVYISGRSIKEKRHYNAPRDLIGERQPFFNHCYLPDGEQVVIVEGQADAITLAQWDMPAIALAGMTISDDLLNSLKSHRRVFVLLDNTPQTEAQTRTICQALGAIAHLPQLPDGVKDANEWLVQGATTESAAKMLNNAASWITAEINRVNQLNGLAREDGLRDLFQYAPQLDTFALANFKQEMGKLGVRARMFNDLVKATENQVDESDDDDDQPEILSDEIPLLSPALGFQKDVALVTVSVMERTRDNRLNLQPYLVTSTRDLYRLNNEQIVDLNGQEIALKVIPEGSEFLMRWRYSDLRRFLDGESVHPGDVFNAVHEIYQRYVDFKSPVESRLLALWVVGTYFYTLFPAYPYLALNGPKNSGKSTVLRVTQPLAFNMITTSDPTGPSMFRLIHHTSCTVGIDEAERYHNPRDPGMQQIRQLLNSGYKQGMPAIRVGGDDFKPQAFDVYSPKILAAIAGLEDVLASRCIAVPMRRTDRKMAAFPPDFDGARIRHQLYTLALTYFGAVHRNYFERPDLHKLHNRSGELWSPLVALAAFFEEAGQVTGLLDAISAAAEWDEQVSEGKSLSEREEAVLQALEIMTRGADNTVWLKASDLREQVRTIMGVAREQMGHAQWIGHILNRLDLTDRNRKRAYAGGQMYHIDRDTVVDVMRRYDVVKIQLDPSEN